MTDTPDTSFAIRPAEPRDELGWRALWQAYNVFYESTVPELATAATWRRILDETSTVGCIVAEDSASGALLGFINYVIHPRTWSANDACYLEDLYVDGAARGRGIGQQLIIALEKICVEKDLSRIYWHTYENNHVARRLYERVAVRDQFIRYVLTLPSGV